MSTYALKNKGGGRGSGRSWRYITISRMWGERREIAVPVCVVACSVLRRTANRAQRSPWKGRLQLLGVMANAAQRPPRRRFDGSSRAFAELIMEFAEDRSIIRYGESERVDGARIDKKAIEAAMPVLVKLQAAMPTLKFKRSTVFSGLQYVAAVKKYEFRDEEEKRDWHITMTRRFLNLCRATSQCLHTDWGRQLFPWLAGVAASTSPGVAACAGESGQDGSEAEESGKGISFGWDQELGQAWRQVPGSKLCEVSLRVEAPDGASDTDQPVAVWPCGFTRAVPHLTCGDLKALQQRRACAKETCEVFFSGDHIDTHHRVVVKSRTDRTQLVSMYEQSKQIAQTRVDDWESVEKAGACMVVVAKEYCAGVLSKQGLLKRRDEIMQADPSVKKNKRKAAGATRQKPARAGEPVDGPPAEGAGQQGRGGSSGAPEEGACARWSVGKLSRPRMHGAAEEPQGSPQEASEAAAATAPVAACAAASTPAVATPLGSRPAQVGPAQSLACVRRHAPGPAWDEVDDDFERLGF